MEAPDAQQQPVTVAIRVRPPNAVDAKHREAPVNNANKLCLGVIPKANAIILSKDDLASMNTSNLPLGSPSHATGSGKKTFTFDKVHGSESSQKDLYESSCSNLVKQFVDGFNVTVFA
ncbi:hypothetical protein HDU98_002502 [Podochytrium sp. JEL0797]|nr:hypothetical protein HDU98_002502 [Podochytrium sp. JEL0797]